jgi:D-alanyl-D-alanine dipeptidase
MTALFKISLLTLVILGMNSCKHEPVQIQEEKPTTPVVVDETDIDYNSSEWTELTTKDNVTIDIRYATSNNFVKEPIYPCGRCFLKPDVADALKKVNQVLITKGYKLKLFDCYRPSPAQQKLWDKVPNPDYVARPSEGSMHSRGSAVDLTMTDLEGNEIYMGTTYDFFGPEAHQDFINLPQPILSNRLILKSAMEGAGFQAIRTEWWHFSFGKGLPPLADWQWTCK